MVGRLVASVAISAHAVSGDLYCCTHESTSGRRPLLPNSGRCALAYLFAGLYVQSVAVIVNSVVRLGSRAALYADSAWLTAAPTFRLAVYRSSVFRIAY